MTTVTLDHSERDATGAAPRAGFWLRVWRALERYGERRAAAEMRLLALHRLASDPEMAQRLKEAAYRR